MKKKVSFEKKIEFPTMIGEICAISLEHNLKFVDESNVEGDLLLTGKYKLTEASRLEEDFSYKIPTEIALIEKIDLNTSKIEISDFTYEIENDNTMICHIELLIDGLELIEEEIIEERQEEDRECDGDPMIEKEIELPKIEKEEIKEEKEREEGKEEEKEEEKVEEEEEVEEIITGKDNEEKKNNFFLNLEDDKDTYGTFIVYMVRQNESIHEIATKYQTSIEEIEKYNDLKEISIGSKLIIPLLHD